VCCSRGRRTCTSWLRRLRYLLPSVRPPSPVVYVGGRGIGECVCGGGLARGYHDDALSCGDAEKGKKGERQRPFDPLVCLFTSHHRLVRVEYSV